MSWFPDGPKKLAVAYCNLEFQGSSPDTSMDSYIWDVGEIHILNRALFSSFHLTHCLWNITFERLGGHLGETVTLSVHKTMPTAL